MNSNAVPEAPPKALESLFSPLDLGEIRLANRIVMAPMTRNRADARGVPGDIVVDYYAQRAQAGLIIAEGTWPSAAGQAYCRQPGIASAVQIDAWRRVTDAVHARGGSIVLQVMHAGRIGSGRIKPAGVETVAPSAIRASGEVYTDAAGMQPFDMPRALASSEIKRLVEEHGQAAINARKAGFDGVELHCTSGYLPMQFLCSGSNQRDDEYGGSVDNRVRFVVECLAAMAQAIGAGRVGYRINPGNTFNDCHDAEPEQTHVQLIRQSAAMELAYVHVMRSPLAELDAFAMARQHTPAALIVNDGFDAASAAEAVAQGRGDAVSFARHFIANPDYVKRLRRGQALARFDRKTLYTPGAAGYSDYPSA